ncbi:MULTISPECIES: tyrosine-type recombinase/integrase [Streptomycetaceae]|uniref:Integrase family protein n=1 Tax=Streptantibioticus cattleyicolor (strain ATCC 35852 / DSM 46488 / JCM 4925 / NBRC 14057 / NRRL 8057) TaxID=1003195 RepID=F8JRW5_STREN
MPLTTDEPRRLLTTPQGRQHAAQFELPLCKGDILGLRWVDLSLDAGTATVRRTHTSGLATLPTKTISSELRIALPAFCVVSPRGHRELQAREKEQTGIDRQDSGYVFTRPGGHPIEPATFTRHFNTLLRDAQLQPIRIRDLRHVTATLLLEQGVEFVVIKELLGHAHTGVPATVCTHVRLHLQRQAMDLLRHALGNLSRATVGPDDGVAPPLCAAARPLTLPSTTAVRQLMGPTGNMFRWGP